MAYLTVCLYTAVMLLQLPRSSRSTKRSPKQLKRSQAHECHDGIAPHSYALEAQHSVLKIEIVLLFRPSQHLRGMLFGPATVSELCLIYMITV